MTCRYKKILSKSLLSILLLGQGSAHAADAVWQGTGSTTTTTELSTATNWAGGTLPSVSTLADFGLSTTPGYTLTATTGDLTALGFVFGNTDPTAYSLTANGHTFAIGTSGVVNNASVTQGLHTSGAGAITIAAVPGGVNSAGSNVNYTIAGTGASLTFAGATTGNGLFTINSGNTFNVGGDSTVGQLASSGSIVLTGSLTVSSAANFSTLDGISGPGAFILSDLTGATYNYMYLEGPNTYTGGTVVNGGSLLLESALPVNGPVTINGGSIGIDVSQVVGNLSGTGGSVNWDDAAHNFNVNQTANANFAGTLVSSNTGATFTLGTPSSTTATGTLQLTGNSSPFVGNVVVDSGNLQVNGNLGATSITVNSGGTLSGTGTFGTLGSLTTVSSGATLAPGNSVGVVTNAGDQLFNAGSFFTLYEDGFTSTATPPGSNSLLIVNGTTTVGAGGAATVNLVPVNNLINFNTTQAFIQSTGGLTVTTPFDVDYVSALTAAGFNLDLVDAPVLSFDENNYYVATQTAFESAVVADSGNKTAVSVAGVFDSIVNPDTPQNLFLNELAKLSTADLVDALDDLSGAQYATQVIAAELSNRQFIRRLYDPLREIVTTEPYDECCRPVNPCCQLYGLDGWVEAGGGQSWVNGDHGASLNEWDITFGLQTTFDQFWTVGIAASYENNNFSYHSAAGSGRGHAWFGGVYGLYRPSCWYVLADLAYGYRQHNITRYYTLGDVVDHFKSRPGISQTTFYAEAGFDYNAYSFLIQPFVGIEVAGFNRKAFTETDVDLSGLSLTVNKHNRTEALSSLGVHLTDQFCEDFTISVDLAWLYRFTNNSHFDASFGSIGSGTSFEVYGPNIGRNSGEGAITFSKDICENWNAYLEASGEVWSRASTYNVVGGLQVTW